MFPTTQVNVESLTRPVFTRISTGIIAIYMNQFTVEKVQACISPVSPILVIHSQIQNFDKQCPWNSHSPPPCTKTRCIQAVFKKHFWGVVTLVHLFLDPFPRITSPYWTLPTYYFKEALPIDFSFKFSTYYLHAPYCPLDRVPPCLPTLRLYPNQKHCLVSVATIKLVQLIQRHHKVYPSVQLLPFNDSSFFLAYL